jgi:DNA-binding response OmpR family regulator
MTTTAGAILVIDDDSDFRASVSVVLEAQDYRVIGAASAKEGLAKIAAEQPDLIILDIMMEHDSAGYEVNQAVKFREDYQLSHDIPILMVSSIPLDPATRFDRAAEVGMITPDCYMTKPLNFSDFIAQVRSLLEQRKRRAAARTSAF